MQLVSTISSGWCTEFRGFIRNEIVIQQGFQACRGMFAEGIQRFKLTYK